MPSYTFTSEQARPRTISTVEEAQRVIIATATTRMHNREQLYMDLQLVAIADCFDIDLSSIVICDSTDPNDFPYTYSFSSN